ncbi:MAG TPA: HAD family phosphatase [Nitrospira sp.]|nr:HAD family phosphatase [Nitrospira sp.]
MIRAIIFDFNGVIADDETPHLLCFQQTLAEENLALSKEEYYGTYLGMDERTCARMLLIQRDGTCDEHQLSRIGERKAELFGLYTARHPPELFPGVIDFVKTARTRYRLAIASGGRRAQIDAALSGTPIEHDFEVIVAAEDCSVGKPDKAIYRLTCERLNAGCVSSETIKPAECLVVEDSLAGIQSAKAAGMLVMALGTTYPLEKLSEADCIFENLQGVTPEVMISKLGRTGHESRLTDTRPR